MADDTTDSIRFKISAAYAGDDLLAQYLNVEESGPHFLISWGEDFGCFDMTMAVTDSSLSDPEAVPDVSEFDSFQPPVYAHYGSQFSMTDGDDGDDLFIRINEQGGRWRRAVGQASPRLFQYMGEWDATESYGGAYNERNGLSGYGSIDALDGSGWTTGLADNTLIELTLSMRVLVD